MSIISGKELLDKKVKPSDQIIQKEINNAAGNKELTEHQKRRCACRRKIEELREERKIRESFAYDI